MRKPRWNVAKAKELAAKALQNRGKIMMNFDISELARICDNCRFAGAGEDDDEVECRRRIQRTFWHIRDIPRGEQIRLVRGVGNAAMKCISGDTGSFLCFGGVGGDDWQGIVF